MKPNAAKRISSTPGSLTIEWLGGGVTEFASIWLRDNLLEDRDPHSGQRLVDIADLPEDPRIRAATADGQYVQIEWEGESRPAAFDLDWLAAHAAGAKLEGLQFTPRLWPEGVARNAARDFAWITLAEAGNRPAARRDWLTRLLEDGIAFLSAVPCDDAAILEAGELLGRIAETNYGLVFDVRSVPQPENLAYSDAGLGLHTDNPYREPVPGFQLLHALIASDEGGESVFADGFAIAEHLRKADPDAFARLSQTAVPFLYRSADAELYAQRPLIQLSCSGEVTAVHYNNRSIAPLRLSANDARGFYRAYRRFAQLLRVPQLRMRCRLRSGQLIAFDNQRILHGRTAFSAAREPRHLRGCYLTRDSVHSEAALLRRELASEVHA